MSKLLVIFCWCDCETLVNMMFTISLHQKVLDTPANSSYSSLVHYVPRPVDDDATSLAAKFIEDPDAFPSARLSLVIPYV